MRGPLEREPRLGQRALDPREERERLDEPRRAAEERDLDARADQALPLGDDLQLAVVGPDGAGPGRRAVDEHAVRKRHAAEAELVRRHR